MNAIRTMNPRLRGHAKKLRPDSEGRPSETRRRSHIMQRCFLGVENAKKNRQKKVLEATLVHTDLVTDIMPDRDHVLELIGCNRCRLNQKLFV